MTTGKKVLIFITILVVVGGVIAFGAYNATRQQAETGIPRNAVPVQLENAHRETIISRVSAKGSVELVDKTVVYPSTQARIEKVLVKEGDRVKEGDVIVTYDTKTLAGYQDQLADAELALRSAELALASTRLPASSTELLQAETQIAQAQKAITDIEAQAAQIDLSLSQLSDSLQTAQDKYDNTQTLFTMGIVTKSELDSAADAVQSIRNQIETTTAQRSAAVAGLPMAQENERLAQAQYDALVNRQKDPKTVNQREAQEIAVAQAQLRVAQIKQDIEEYKTEEHATASGTILAVYAAIGDMATTGRALADIAEVSNDNLVIRIDIPESDARNIAEGQETDIKGAALGERVYKGHVSRIHPLAEKKQIGSALETVLTVEIAPDDPAIPLRAGYSIETSIITGVAEDTMVVPLMSTLSDTDGNHFVYIMRADYSVEKRVVTLGEYSGLYVQAEGVTEDDRIILNPSGQITEGVFVKPIL